MTSYNPTDPEKFPNATEIFAPILRAAMNFHPSFRKPIPEFRPLRIAKACARCDSPLPTDQPSYTALCTPCKSGLEDARFATDPPPFDEAA